MPHWAPSGDLNNLNLRLFLGEQIPPGGTEEDTMFTDAQLTELISSSGGDWSVALADGWGIKAAALAGLVDTAEGTAKRAMSDLHDHALTQVKFYSEAAIGAGATHIHRIVRR